MLTLLLAAAGLYAYQAGGLSQLARNMARFDLPRAEAPSNQAIQAFFTTPTLVYPDKPWQRPEVPLLDRLLSDIDAAQASIDLASFDIDLNPLADALLRAHRRDVVVRVVIDSENLITPEVAEQAGRFERSGVLVRWDRREPFMHHKFAVIDGRVAWLGSWNMTENDTYRNNNNMLRLASRQLAADYANEFEQMFAGRFGTSKRSATPYPQVGVGAAKVEVYFSPEDGVAKHVLQRIAAARRSIQFMAFSYTADAIAEAMVGKAQTGISVQGVFESQNARGTGADFNRLKQGGVNVLEDGNCYIMHHKVIIIDERTVITGSYNFTGSAEHDNDENLVIVDDPTVAKTYLDEFERVYRWAQNPSRCQ